MHRYADNVLHIRAVFEKRMSGWGQGQCLDMGKFDTPESAFECSRIGVIHPSYLQRV